MSKIHKHLKLKRDEAMQIIHISKAVAILTSSAEGIAGCCLLHVVFCYQTKALPRT